MNKKLPTRDGFTLLELSIVLVIIGLIIGGITAGQELIRAAELNSVISDVNKYKVAINSFKLKYNALPGDMDNAQSYWPSCIDNGLTPSNTCNGDGDGILESYESTRTWQHLSLSETISGNYKGRQVTPMADEEIFPFLLNHPLHLRYDVDYYDKTGSLTTDKKHKFSQSYDKTVLDELSMIQLDTKYDDGKPESGKVRLGIGDSVDTECLTATSPAEYDYTASGSFYECNPQFMLD